ncbi:hypothetical protein PHSY_005273 [Pseudozyma hubeiensis SY62]|uniref:Uncharacterized protein n=1 Tax=Pseudozyma hubeiensis (strain SY62) TaxID=1305764 RepID=R9P8V0_PSEHS|nr:hypothetical protein PHSY_005273 [Pseudozyma hubeiensis SY62]GAC97687.1 hypothetical protein PHSY_005273 [Pseudozyma hubeiensis SY62]
MIQDTLALASVGNSLEYWSRSPLHPTLLPVGALALVHAARVSHATRQVAGSHRYRLTLWQGFLLNQILMFGGVVISGMLLGIPSPLLSAWPVVVLYGGVHVLLDASPFGNLLLQAQDLGSVRTLMDLSFALLDGILRAEGIIDLGVEPVLRHPSPEVSSSIFAAILNAAIIGGGVPLLIDLLNLDSPTGEWGIRTPAWVKHPLQGTNDIFSAGALGFVYLSLTSSSIPAQFPIVAAVVDSLGLDKLSNGEVRTFCSLLLGAMLLAEKATLLSMTASPASKPKSRATGGVAAPGEKSAARKNTASNGSIKNRKQAARKQQ